MNLDELLTQAGSVEAPPGHVIDRLDAELTLAARQEIARRAVLVRRRRLARYATVGLGAAAAAAIVGTVALQPGVGHDQHAEPGITQSPIITAPEFKTVAQVVNAAVDGTPNVDPTAAPYWKTVRIEHGYGTVPRLDGTSCIEPYDQTITNWMSSGSATSVFMNTGPQVGHDSGKPISAGGGGMVPFDGRTMTWKQINAGHWTDSQLAALVADDGPSGKEGRASSTYYVFKNTLELLQNSPASPTIRKQYWRMLGAMPGVHLDGRAKDVMGRAGWQLSYSYPGYGTETAIVDTATGTPLQSGGSDQYAASPGYDTLVSAGPSQTAPTPQPEWNPTPPAPGSAEWNRAVQHLKLWKNWKQAVNQPTPYPACTAADIANMS